MWILDLLKKRPLTFQMNAVLVASGLAVGYTRCHLLSEHPDVYGYLACFIVGYVASLLVALFAGALSAYLLNLDAKHNLEMVMIIAAMTLIVASLLILVSFLGGSLGGFEDME